MDCFASLTNFICGLLRRKEEPSSGVAIQVPDITIPQPHQLKEMSGAWIPHSREPSAGPSRVSTPAPAVVSAAAAAPSSVPTAAAAASSPSDPSPAAAPPPPPTPTITPRGGRLATIPPLSLPPPSSSSTNTNTTTSTNTTTNLVVLPILSIDYDLPPSIINTILLTQLRALAMSPSTSTSTSTSSYQQPHNAGLSQSWISPAASNAAKFTRLQTVASHLHLLRSPFFPRTATEYNAHNAAFASDLAKKQRRVLEGRIRELEGRKKEREFVMSGARTVSGIENENGNGLGGNLWSGKVNLKSLEEVKIAGCELAWVFKGERKASKGEKAGEVGGYVGFSGVLGEKTCFWAGGEEGLMEGKVGFGKGMRAFWPEMGELKMEGEMRVRKMRQRRFPLPRVDLYSTGMMRHFIPPHIALTPAEKSALIDQIIAKKASGDMAWHERQVVPFKHKLDRLPTLTKIWRQNEKTDNGRPYYTPPTPTYDEKQMQGEDYAVREGGDDMQEYGAGDEFSSDGEVFGEDGYGYNAANDEDGYSNIIPENIYAVDENGDIYPQVYHEQDGPVQGYGDCSYDGNNAYDGHDLPVSYSNGADGPGNGMRLPPGGWIFDEDALKERGEWADILDEINYAADDEA